MSMYESCLQQTLQGNARKLMTKTSLVATYMWLHLT
jgi:hypothetical protein